ncbi:hypothetical protein RHECNPAF_470049 [Rhizobium etli CNPAF512]|nr:hypothetical protein RHECNPAF_470049 [Rhizobium etli CNPAF512]
MPPSAITTRMLISQSGDKQCLDRMQTVLRLLEGDIGLGLEDVVGDFKPVVHAVIFSDLLAERGFGVVKSRQAMHELGLRIAGRFHQVLVDLIGGEQLDTFAPDLLRLAHRDPDIGVNEIDVLDRFPGILGDQQARARGLLQNLGDLHVFFRRPQRSRPADAHIHAEQAADDQQRMSHIRAGVADIGIFDLSNRLVAMFAHGHDVGDHLRRMIFVRQSVIDGHPGVFCQRLHAFLRRAAIFDRIIHAPQHPRRVLEGFLVANLRAGGIEIGHVGALVRAGDLEGASRSRRGLLEDQANFLAFQMLLFGAGVFGPLQVASEVEEVTEFPRRIVLHGQKRSIAQIEAHGLAPSVWFMV